MVRTCALALHLLAASAHAAAVGDTVAISEPAPVPLAGRVVLVNFWASWCAPCRAELPLLDALATELGAEGAAVVGVNLDTQRAAAEGVVKRTKLGMPVIYDPKGEIAARFEPPAMPSTYLVGADGRIVRIYEGELDTARLEEVRRDVRALLGARR